MSDPLLDHLRSAGQPDSTGRFTLDPLKALEKLRRFALPDPERYVVHVVECAVMGGAGRIQVGRDGVEFDGEPFRSADLVALLPGLLEGRWSTADRLHPLAVAVNGVLQGLADEVVLETGGVSFRWDRRGVESGEGGSLSPDRHALRIRRPGPRGLLARFRPPGRELEQLLVHCMHCPVPLDAFGRNLSTPLHLGSTLLVTRLLSPHPLPPLGPLPAACVGLPSPGPFSALVLLGSSALSAGVHVHSAGRLYVMPSTLPEGIGALVSTDRLQTDLGRNHLVRDALYDDILAALREEGGRLRQVLVRDLATMDEGDRQRALPLLHGLSLEKARAGQWAEAARLAERVARDVPSVPGDGVRSAALYRAALLHLQAGLAERAVELAWEALGDRPYHGGPHLRCVVEEPTPEEGGPFPCVPMKGTAEDLLALQSWLLEMGIGVLGPRHPVVVARRRVVQDLCLRHGFELPREADFRDPWRSPELGGFPRPSQAG